MKTFSYLSLKTLSTFKLKQILNKTEQFHDFFYQKSCIYILLNRIQIYTQFLAIWDKTKLTISCFLNSEIIINPNSLNYFFYDIKRNMQSNVLFM